MESTHSYTLPVPPQRAWDALTDAQVLRASIPGCDHLVADGEEAFAFAVNTSLDGVKARFTGHMRMIPSEAPRACTLRFESEAGSEAGAVGSAQLQLEADGEASTTLSCVARGSTNGNGGAVMKMADEFVKRFAAHVSGDGVTAEGDAPLPGDPSVQHAAVAESAPAGKGAKSWKAWKA
jgi:hypothetical protein